MPLDKTCSVDAMGKNIAQSVKDGKPQPQAVAISYSVLKKACGVEGEKKMTPKEIVAAGEKKEGRIRVAFGEATSSTKYLLGDIDGIEGTVEKPGKAVEDTLAALNDAMSGFAPFRELPEVYVEFIARGKDKVELLLTFDDVEDSLLQCDSVLEILHDWDTDEPEGGMRLWGKSERNKIQKEAIKRYVSKELSRDMERHLQGSKFIVKDVRETLQGRLKLTVNPSDFGLTVESVSTKVKVAFGSKSMDEKDTGEATPMVCNECGAKFKKKLTAKTFEVKCPKCGSYDTEPAGM